LKSDGNRCIGTTLWNAHHLSLNKTSIQELVNMSSDRLWASGAVVVRFYTPADWSSIMGALRNWQNRSGVVRLGVVWNGCWSRVWRGRGAVLVSLVLVRRQGSVEVKGSGQTVQAKLSVVANL
jgi:hypothetical protein